LCSSSRRSAPSTLLREGRHGTSHTRECARTGRQGPTPKKRNTTCPTSLCTNREGCLATQQSAHRRTGCPTWMVGGGGPTGKHAQRQLGCRGDGQPPHQRAAGPHSHVPRLHLLVKGPGDKPCGARPCYTPNGVPMGASDLLGGAILQWQAYPTQARPHTHTQGVIRQARAKNKSPGGVGTPARVAQQQTRKCVVAHSCNCAQRGAWRGLPHEKSPPLTHHERSGVALRFGVGVLSMVCHGLRSASFPLCISCRRPSPVCVAWCYVCFLFLAGCCCCA
jgi:hypothetical protein